MKRVEPHKTATTTLTVNGVRRQIEVEARWLLSDVLRRVLGLTGTHVGCEQGACGACGVLLDGEQVTSCTMLAISADGADITTVEGLAADARFAPLREAFADCGALQCGFCTPGMLVACAAMIAEGCPPDRTAIRRRLTGNLCRCTGYAGIVDAASRVLSRDATP
jgi:carbon-monoxide dehydrogenase small subunit